LFEASHGSAVPASYVQAPPSNILYGRTGWLRPSSDQRLPRKDGPEQALFPGFCALLLAVLGVAAAPRRLRATTRVYAGVGLLGVALSLGPDGIRPVYAALYDTLVGMQGIRAPARFSVLALCAIAVLASIAVVALDERRFRGRNVVVAAVFAILSLEYANGAIAFSAAPVLASDVGRWLRSQPGSGAVVCLPMEFDAPNTPCMLQSLEHQRPIVNGYSGFRPPFFAALVDVARAMPSAGSLLAFHDLGVEYVVSDRPLLVDAALGGVLVERARFGTERIYQIVWSPAIAAAVAPRADTPPPEPASPRSKPARPQPTGFAGPAGR